MFFFRTRRITLGWRELLAHLDYGERFDPRGTFCSVATWRLASFGGVEGYVDRLLKTMAGDAGAFSPVTDADLVVLGSGGKAMPTEVNRELELIRVKLAEQPRLTEGLEPQAHVVTERPRSAAFRVAVKRLYGERCAVCGSGLRGPNDEPEVEAAHIFPKSEDGSDDVRNGLCLCRQHHWAFDVGWMSISSDGTVLMRDDLPDESEYGFIRAFCGRALCPPEMVGAGPDELYASQHRALHGFD